MHHPHCAGCGTRNALVPYHVNTLGPQGYVLRAGDSTNIWSGAMPQDTAGGYAP